ncbi:MAG: alpha/beta hydrolase [Candidatus Paceibacterota bacterium]
MYQEFFELENPQGLKIKGQYFVPGGFGPYATVLFCHGFTGNYREKQNMVFLQELARSGILAVGFDFTNEANSSSDGDFFNLTLDSEMSDVNAVLDFIKKNPYVDHKSIGLCGHSLGGIVATKLAADRNHEVKALATISSLWNPKEELTLILEIAITIWKRQGYLDFARMTPEWGVGDKRLGYGFYESVSKYDPGETIRKIGMPTLVMHGADDDTILVSSGHKLFDELKGDKTLKIIEKGDHIFSDPESLKEASKTLSEWFCQKLDR